MLWQDREVLWFPLSAACVIDEVASQVDHPESHIQNHAKVARLANGGTYDATKHFHNGEFDTLQ